MMISIVMPVLNRASTLPDALGSIDQQTYEKTELVVQDGGSTDGTLKLLFDRKNSHPMRVQSAHDGGLYDAINKGVARCHGDVIGLLSSDDMLADDQVLADIARAFRDPSIDAIYGDLQILSASGRVIRHWRAGPFSRRRLSWGWMPPHPTLYVRRSVIERFGDYDSAYRIAGDYDAMLRWIGAGEIKLGYVPRVLVKMRHGGVSTNLGAGLLTKAREDYRALRANQAGGAGTLLAKNLRKLGQFAPLLRNPGH